MFVRHCRIGLDELIVPCCEEHQLFDLQYQMLDGGLGHCTFTPFGKLVQTFAQHHRVHHL